MKKIVFLILHYYTLNDTIKCVNSIEKLKYKNKEIVIVDNCSPNGTGKELQEKYRNRKDIHIILSNQNLGFARGNNLGFLYAKEKLHADFIVMCNNDTIVIEADFIEKILEKFNKYNYAVLGPKIKLRDGNFNKLYLKLPTVKEFKNEILYFKRMLLFNYLHLENLLRRVKQKFKKNVSTYNKNVNKFHKNIILHGCFLVFSPLYINQFDGLDSRTFMYREEELLAIRLIKSGMNSVYCPDIVIYHDEDSSTRAVNKNSLKKKRFFYKNQLKSCDIVLEELINLK